MVLSFTDTEGGVPEVRLAAAARSVVEGSSCKVPSHSPLARSSADRLFLFSSTVQAEDLLDGISLMRIHTISQFVGFSRSLTRYLETHPQVWPFFLVSAYLLSKLTSLNLCPQTKLVIVDTVSFHVRPPSLAPDKQARVRILQRLKEEAQKCALRFTCAVRSLFQPPPAKPSARWLTSCVFALLAVRVHGADGHQVQGRGRHPQRSRRRPSGSVCPTW